MKTGDVVRDGQGHLYQIGPMLGRGLWGGFAKRWDRVFSTFEPHHLVVFGA